MFRCMGRDARHGVGSRFRGELRLTMRANRIRRDIDCRPLCVAMLLTASLVVSALAQAGEPVRITRDGLLKQRPAWSPDGKLLAFSRHRGDKIAVFLCKPDGSDERRLTQRTDPEYDAVWSPDGKRLALAIDKASPNQGDMDVYTVDVAGKDLRPVAVTMGQLSHEESPAWSPDGKWIAYSSTKHGNQELYIA